MNVVAILLLSVFIAGCTHVAVVGFDKSANTVTIQGGKFDSERDMEVAAENYCKSPVTLVSMQQGNAGAYTSFNNSFGNTNAVTTPIRRNFLTYSCNR